MKLPRDVAELFVAASFLPFAGEPMAAAARPSRPQPAAARPPRPQPRVAKAPFDWRR